MSIWLAGGPVHVLTDFGRHLFAIYSCLFRSWRPLVRVALVWFIIALAGQALTGARDMVTQPPAASLGGWLGSLLHIFAILAAWYCAHRFMLDPAARIEYLPSPRQRRFLLTQFLILIALSVLLSVLLMPLVFLAMPALDAGLDVLAAQQLAQAEAQRWVPLGGLLIVALFGRLLLLAPLLVRDAPHALRRSWQLTRGHTLRLFFLQLGCLLPVLIGSLLSWLLTPFYWIALLLSVTGVFISLLAYTRLAEDEYARLG